jgi:hypothetical protein
VFLLVLFFAPKKITIKNNFNSNNFMIRVNWNRVAKVLRFVATVITTVLGTIAVQSCAQ